MNDFQDDQKTARLKLPVGQRFLWLMVSVTRRRVFGWGWRRLGFASGGMGFGFGAFTYVWVHA